MLTLSRHVDIYLNGATEYEDGLAECLSAAYNTSAVLSCNASPETVKITALDEVSLSLSKRQAEAHESLHADRLWPLRRLHR